MFTKARSYIRNLMTVTVSDRYREEFTDDIQAINVARAKLTCRMFIFLEIILLASTLFVQKGRALLVPERYYTVLYIVMLFVMLVFLALFGRLGEEVAANRAAIYFTGIAFVSFILCWCAVTSVLDACSSGQIMVYVVAVIAVAVTPFLEPIVLLLIYVSVHTVFLILLFHFQRSYGTLFGLVMNSTTFLIVSWMISMIRYRQQALAFSDEKLIEEKNVELSRINVELQEANQKLEEISRVDGLTGIYNRSMFDKTIQSEWGRCMRQFKPLSLLMIDIDFFKNFNDHYGHRAGDDCLRRVTGALSACAKRASDTLARYGGEEFAVILPYTGQAEAYSMAELMREKVEALEIPHSNSGISAYVTISIGVYTACPSGILSVEAFIENADRALYDAKKYRNRVIVA